MFGAAATGVSQFHVADPAAPSEMIAVTNVSGTTWTVTRGAESTIPVQHAAGFTVYQVTTAGFLGAAVPVTVTVPLPTGATATDTPAVTAAISSLVTALASGPATLLFQDGTYQIDSDSAVIQSVSNFAVRSAGATVIQLAPNRSGQYNTNGDLFVIADCTDFWVEGIELDWRRDTVAPMTPLTASASSGQPSVTVAAGNGARYLAGQRLQLYGGLGTAEQSQVDSPTARASPSPRSPRAAARAAATRSRLRRTSEAATPTSAAPLYQTGSGPTLTTAPTCPRTRPAPAVLSLLGCSATRTPRTPCT